MSDSDYDMDSENDGYDTDDGYLYGYEFPSNFAPDDTTLNCDEQEENIQRVSTALSISRDIATIRLYHYGWDVQKVIDAARLSDQDRVCNTTILPQKLPENQVVRVQDIKELNCAICFKDYPSDRMCAADCGLHHFCSPCLRDYSGCSGLSCPNPSCIADVGQEMITFSAVDSTASMDYISVDLLCEILKHVPLRSAVRFKVLSKNIFAEFEGKRFATMRSSIGKPQILVVSPSSKQGNHNLRNCMTGNLYMDFLHTDLFRETFEHVYTQRRFGYSAILGSVEGVICFVDSAQDAICLFNLTTRQLSSWVHHVPLIEDYNCSYVFGYNERRRSFKVLCITKYNSSGSTVWEVLEFPECIWKRIDLPPSFVTNGNPKALYFRNSFYILSEIQIDYSVVISHKFISNGPVSILVLDLANDSYRIHHIPNQVLEFIFLQGLDYQRWVKLIEVKDSIAIIRSMSFTELRLCYVKDISQGLDDVANWRKIDIMLPPTKYPETHGEFLFDVIRGTSELLMEIHKKKYNCPAHVSLHTIDFDEVYSHSDLELVRTLNWKSIQLRGHQEHIADDLYCSFGSCKMIFPFEENLRQLASRNYSCDKVGNKLRTATGANSILQISEVSGPPRMIAEGSLQWSQ